MKERSPQITLSEEVKKAVKFKQPEYHMVVRLPYIRSYGEGFWDQKHQYMSMHTDMMGSLCRTLCGLKSEIRDELLIEGRVMGKKEWNKLTKHPAYTFFYVRRVYRNNLDVRKETVSYLVPKSLKLTDRQLRNYVNLDFKPETLSGEIGFRVGWYPAEYLMEKAKNETSFNSLAPFLGAVNQFQIGSNGLKPGILRMIGLRLMLNFEKETGNVAKSLVNRLSEKVITASSKVLYIPDDYWY
jgi:hypothetical protein